MARILAVFEFTMELNEIRNALGPGHELLHAHDLAEARVWARTGGVDLVVATTGLKDAEPGYLCVLLGKLVGEGTPFIFVKDPAAKRALPDTPVLARPLSPKALVDAVDFALKHRRREEGKFDDGSLDELLGRVGEAKESGVLTAFYERLIKRVVVTDGCVSFAGSNDPSELVGQAFIRAGLISERDLIEAVEVQGKTSEPLGKVLQALRKVTKDQVQRIIAEKFSESVVDLYLWREGRWVFQRDGGFARPPADRFMLDLSAIRAEGRARAERWQALAARFPQESIRFGVDVALASLPPSAPWVERRVMTLAREGKTLGEIVLEVRGQEYQVYDFVARMVDRRVFVHEAPLSSDRARSLQRDLGANPSGEVVISFVEPSEEASPPSSRPFSARKPTRPSALPPRPPSAAPRGEPAAVDGAEGRATVPERRARDAAAPRERATKPDRLGAVGALEPGGRARPHLAGASSATSQANLRAMNSVPKEARPTQPEALRRKDPGVPSSVPTSPVPPGGGGTTGESSEEPPSLEALIFGDVEVPTGDGDSDEPTSDSLDPLVEFPGMDPTAASLLVDARKARIAGDLDFAMQTLRYVLIIDPLNAVVRRELEEAEGAARTDRHDEGLNPDQRVRLSVELTELTGMVLSPEEAFVLTRLANESMRVRDLTAICPLEEHEILTIIARHVRAGIVETRPSSQRSS